MLAAKRHTRWILIVGVVLTVGAVTSWRVVARFRATRSLVTELSHELVPGEKPGWWRYEAPRHAAQLREHLIVKRLLDAGADPNAVTADYAPASLSVRLMRTLRDLAHGGSRPTGEWTSVLGLAIDRDPEVLREVLAQGANPKLSVDNQGNGALSRALKHELPSGESGQEIALLFRYGADARTRDGAEAIAMAAALDDIPAATLLLQHGAGCRTQGDDGPSAVLMSLLMNHADMLELLLNHGAKVDLSEPLEGGTTTIEGGVSGSYSYHTLGGLIRANMHGTSFKDVARVLRAHGVVLK
jgi:hypothetical protein